MINLLLQFFKFFGILFFIVVYMVHSVFIWVAYADHWQARRKALPWHGYYCTIALKILGIKVNVQRPSESRVQGSALYVGNHLSYLDILITAAIEPTCFVTSVEMRDTPLLGTICRLAGCLFVERRSRLNLHNEIKEITQGLQESLDVTIFPESTSTNGEELLRFRNPLYLAAIDADKPIVPFCINYVQVGSEPLSLSNRDFVFWYGDMPFVSHLWNVCGLGGIKVELTYLPAIDPRGKERSQLALESYEQVKTAFRPIRPEEDIKAN